MNITITSAIRTNTKSPGAGKEILSVCVPAGPGLKNYVQHHSRAVAGTFVHTFFPDTSNAFQFVFIKAGSGSKKEYLIESNTGINYFLHRTSTCEFKSACHAGFAAGELLGYTMKRLNKLQEHIFIYKLKGLFFFSRNFLQQEV